MAPATKRKLIDIKKKSISLKRLIENKLEEAPGKPIMCFSQALSASSLH